MCKEIVASWFVSIEAFIKKSNQKTSSIFTYITCLNEPIGAFLMGESELTFKGESTRDSFVSKSFLEGFNTEILVGMRDKWSKKLYS